MASPAKLLVISLDAADPGLVRELAEAGEMPAVASLLRDGARVHTEAPMGVFVSANWPTLFTGRSPDRHRYLCWEEIPGGTYDYRQTDPTWVEGAPIWKRLSEAGRRVAVFDVPHSIPEPLDGAMVSEWSCHDRHFGPGSWPPELVDELTERHGRPLGARPATHAEQHAPCDYAHRAGAVRTEAETRALIDDVLAAIDIKAKASLELLDRGGWDLFLTVMGESHCIGHQLWHLHDPAHEKHDPALVARLGGDPVREVYRRLDRVVAAHLERIGPDATAWVLLAHGMTAHHDGTHLLDPVLARLDWSLDHPDGLGTGMRAIDAATRRLPRALKTRALRAATPALRRGLTPQRPAELPPIATRRWFLTPNNTVVGAVRLNLAGREPRGRVHPDDRREVLHWLGERLTELVNLDTGGPVVTRCELAEDHYRRSPGDALADLFVEWERSAPIERVWSPSIGTLTVPYNHWRQGDHERGGILMARGPGLRPGARRGVSPIVDVGPTICAALGVDLPDADGRPIASLLPGAGRAETATGRLRRRAAGLADRIPAARSPAWARRQDPAVPRALAALEGLTARADAMDRALERLRARADGHDRHHDVATMTAWLRQAHVEPGPRISVVTPTRDRRALLESAVDSVLAQTYPAWELVVVDDGSTDDTPAFLAGLEDPRIRVLAADGVGACAARNVALEAATGEVIVYLDDDNRFDPDWLKAVAHTFRSRPEATALYGARVVDDHGRLFERDPDARPWLHYASWEPEAIQHGNLADMNVIAHRAGPIRFDEALAFYGDWDLLLRLAQDAAPVEVPAVAAYYRTDVPGRLSTSLPQDDIEREFRHVREKLAAAS